MASIRIQLDGYKKKDGTHNLKVYIYHNQSRMECSTGIAIHPSKWNEKKEEAKDPKINLSLLKIKERMHSLIQDNQSASAAEIIRLYKGGEGSKISVHEYLNSFIDRLSMQGKEGNHKVYSDLKWQLEKFAYLKDRPFREINYRFIKQFDEYMIGKGYKPNSRAFYHAKLRALINHATKEHGVIERGQNPYLDFKLPKERTKKRHLSKNDLTEIVNYSGRYKKARDYFLWSFAHCGIDIVDYYYLRPNNMTSGRLRYNRRKTNAPIDVLLLSEPPNVFTKKDYTFFIGWRKRMNKALREMSEEIELELDFNLTSKVARHSWATIAKQSGVPIDLIGEMLGHRPPVVTEIYLGDFRRDIKDQAQRKVFEIFF